MTMGRKGVNWETGVGGIDMPELLFQLATNTNATWLFWFLVKNRNLKTNVTVMQPKDFEEAEIGRIKRGRKVLEELGLIKRYKNNHYLINPNAVYPMSANYLDICKHWLAETGEDLTVSSFVTLREVQP